MYAAFSYPHAKAVTLGIRRTGPCGQLQVGVEVRVKNDAEVWVLSPVSVLSGRAGFLDFGLLLLPCLFSLSGV